MNSSSKIIYTLTDEAPLLSTYSFLPIVFLFLKGTDILIEICDISLPIRILNTFPEYLNFEQRKINGLHYLKKIVKKRIANIIKLPNISASLPQLKMSIKELKSQGYCIPDYIDNPKNTCEKKIKNSYDSVIGSAVNPILRNGNSVRYVPSLMKTYAKKLTSEITDEWSLSSQSHVSYMEHGDFYSNEQSTIISKKSNVRIILRNKNGLEKILKKNILLESGDIIDATFMDINLLTDFIREQIQDAENKKILLSIHLKSTMMKVSDPIMFGVMVREFYNNVYQCYKEYFQSFKINLNNGISDLYDKLCQFPDNIQNAVKESIRLIYLNRPKLAMVDYENYITNLHYPNGFIIDSSMSEMIRCSGKMWGDDGKLHDVKSIIPDRCYARMYQLMIDDCKKNGAFNAKNMGSMFNIGLMAQKAEEYGSHDTTFEIPNDGIIQVIDNRNDILFEHTVKIGDIWRLCRTKNIAIQNWIQLAFKYVKKYDIPAVFWLDKKRPHDSCIIKKIQCYLKKMNTISGVKIPILSPEKAMQFSIEQIRVGRNVISVTGNVLRDYLTDLFPILELGTSSRILSITELISNGVLFETGAGGSAPKHVEQFIKYNHLSWDSLGEFFALAESLKHVHEYNKNLKAQILSESLYRGIDKLLYTNRLPSKKIGELDSRGSHFYLALYWSEALSLQNFDISLQKKFKIIHHMLFSNERIIIRELNQIQGKNVNIGGYYHPNVKKLVNIMRPSVTLNNILQQCLFL